VMEENITYLLQIRLAYDRCTRNPQSGKAVAKTYCAVTRENDVLEAAADRTPH
jgi:hypothetical protein